MVKDGRWRNLVTGLRVIISSLFLQDFHDTYSQFV